MYSRTVSALKNPLREVKLRVTPREADYPCEYDFLYEGVVHGWCSLSSDKWVGEPALRIVFIEAEPKRHGYGTEFLRVLGKLAESKGLRQILAESNTLDTDRFYESAGFRVCQQEEGIPTYLKTADPDGLFNWPPRKKGS